MNTTVERLADLGIDLRNQAAGEIYTTCPACSPRRRKSPRAHCLSVDIDRGLYNCHHCGWSGRVAGSGDYGTAPKAKTYTPPDPAIGIAQVLRNPALAWLESRGITRPVIERAGIFSRRIWMPQVDGEVWAIGFPYRRGGELVNVKYRDAKKNFRMEKGAERCLYGLDDVIPGGDLLWVEGEMDKLACAVAGFVSCVSIPNGAPPPTARNLASHYEPIDTAIPVVGKARRHIIAVDDDEPGRGLRDELIRRFGPEHCRVALWPEGCKDANNVLIRHGAAELARCIESAIDVPIVGIFAPDDLADALSDYYDQGAQPGIAAGTPKLAAHYRPIAGQWTVVGGVPGHGKTTWLDWYIYSLMESQGWRFCICSPENLPIQRHLSRLVQLHTGKPFHDGPNERMTRAEMQDGAAWLQDRVRFLYPREDDRGGYSLASILDLCRAEITRFGVKGVVIDPWNELEHSYPPGMREDQYLGQSLIRLRSFARRYDVHIWMVAHPTKMHRDREGKLPIPTLYDLSGGSMWANKADAGITIHRADLGGAGHTDVYIQKIRFQPEAGRVGVVPLDYSPLSGRFRDKEEKA